MTWGHTSCQVSNGTRGAKVFLRENMLCPCGREIGVTPVQANAIGELNRENTLYVRQNDSRVAARLADE
jgi:hypothetical protein